MSSKHTKILDKKIGSERLYMPLCEDSLAWMRKHHAKYNHGFLLVNDQITQAHGRQERTWSVLDGQLLFTILLKPHQPINYISLFIALSTGVLNGLKVGVESTLDYNSLGMKWPNDIMLNQKKAGGMLAKTIFSGEKLTGYIFGIGINLNTVFPDNHPLKNHATSFRELHPDLSLSFDPLAIERSILTELNRYYTLWEQNKHSRIFNAWASTQIIQPGEKITTHLADETEITGTLVCYHPDGDITINTQSGHHKIAFTQT